MRRESGTISDRFPESVELPVELVTELFIDAGCAVRHIELLTGQPAARVRRELVRAGIPVR